MGLVDFELGDFSLNDFHQFIIFRYFSKVNISESIFQKKDKKLQAFYYSHRGEVYTILSKSEGVPFQILFFWGDLTWNDPITIHIHHSWLTFSTHGNTVGAKEIFTPYKSRKHIYKSNV